VYATIANNYPRPIPTPIKNLRPARETCEQCHWPEKFYPQTLRVQRHYLNDEANTPWDIYLNIKTGGAFAELGLEEGIHWHINPNVEISYFSPDEKNLEIPWIKYTNKKTGEVVIYTSEDQEIDESEIAASQLKVMDCMDCHNRPSHSYRPPAFFVNTALTAGTIPADLPEIKSLAMEICDNEFPTADSANKYIADAINEFYASDYPEIAEEAPEKISRAITGLQAEFAKNIFPEMKARWDVYPNHIGHLEFDGCFRCHDDLHVSESGETISKDCDQCHGIIAQGEPDDMEVATIGTALEFQHPVDIDGAWQDGLCTDCHTGLNP
jgi:nitrate/TMAO reductase-like tetraheme cytochrome c subunit